VEEKSNVRTVRYIGTHNCEDLYRCIDNGRVYIRQTLNTSNPVGLVRWLTTSKWSGGYEANCPIKCGITMRVIDRKRNVLFEETVENIDGVFAGKAAVKKGNSMSEEIANHANRLKKELGLNLLSYEAWKKTMMDDAKHHGFTGYSDNWLYPESDYMEKSIIQTFEMLGVPAALSCQRARHRISKRMYLCYEIIDLKDNLTFDLLGYEDYGIYE